MKRRFNRGFTLVELLVATSVLMLLMVVMLSIISYTGDAWRKANARTESFQGARRGFEQLTQALEQATLNTYWDYDIPNAPTRYIRQSELHFMIATAGEGGLPGTPGTGQSIFFQAPVNRTELADREGLDGLLNACGFYIEYGSDLDWLPAHIDPSRARWRYRLMQWLEPTEALQVYAQGGRGWIPSAPGSSAFPVADNVVALIIWPKEEGAPTVPVLDAYLYDSRQDARAAALNQLPPVVQIALIAVDEGSVERLGNQLQTTLQECFHGLFDPTQSASTHFATDLRTLEANFSARSISHRIFVSGIPLREARWSR